ncbi:hypothetical protein [Streptomyces kronopolitis]|uniref:hypothetical protein n=1 Tax=Streptomyces kronopolitis TaxID=1612435 RepID=UPI0020C09EBE|nr:hypothetical protein [Streptomyces kronopolitis]MCL6301311.1 hypothetical protein [Streptomyces kronopolitis]
MGEDLGEQQIGAGEAGEGAVMPKWLSFWRWRHWTDTPAVAVCGEHPPTSDRGHWPASKTAEVPAMVSTALLASSAGFI